MRGAKYDAVGTKSGNYGAERANRGLIGCPIESGKCRGRLEKCRAWRDAGFGQGVFRRCRRFSNMSHGRKLRRVTPSAPALARYAGAEGRGAPKQRRNEARLGVFAPVLVRPEAAERRQPATEWENDARLRVFAPRCRLGARRLPHCAAPEKRKAAWERLSGT